MKRILWIDIYKGVLILLVMIGHALQYSLKDGCFDSVLWNIIYSFHMPAFFAVSGIFAHSRIDDLKELGNVIWRRFRQLLIPMTCWQLLLDMTHIHSGFNPLKYLDCGSFWFLWALFFISMFYSLACWLAQRIKIKAIFLHVALAIVLFVIYVFLGYKKHGFHYIAYYYPYYVLGYYLYRSVKIQELKTWLLWAMAGLWFVLSLFWRMHGYPFYMSILSFLPETLLVIMNRYFVGCLAIISLSGLAKHYLNKEGGLINSALTFLGTTSLALYTIHVSLFEMGRIRSMQLIANVYIEVALVFLIFLIVSVLIVSLVKKNKWTAMFLLGKIN